MNNGDLLGDLNQTKNVSFFIGSTTIRNTINPFIKPLEWGGGGCKDAVEPGNQ